MTTETPDDVGAAPDAMQEAPAPACVMSFNASDPSGAGGLSGDVATIAAMGAHALPVVAAILMRDTAEVFDQHAIDTVAPGASRSARNATTRCVAKQAGGSPRETTNSRLSR